MNAQKHRIKKSISPFLSKAGTPRSGENNLPGYYCGQHQMWVVDTEQGVLPIIEKQALSQLMTKTRAYEEEDDDSYFALELMTKTHQQAESDDDTRPREHNNLLQLATKTDSVQESDDESANHILNLATKTEVTQETDDDDYHLFNFQN